MSNNFINVSNEEFTRTGKALLKKKINKYLKDTMPQIAHFIKKDAQWFYEEVEKYYLFLRDEDKNKTQEITEQEVVDAIVGTIGLLIYDRGEGMKE